MFNKDFKNALILIKVMLLYVSAETDRERELFNFQLNDILMNNVCWPPVFEAYSQDECSKIVSNTTFESNAPTSTVIIRCQTSTNVIIQIPPSERWQVVILKPESPNDQIEYVPVQPMDEYEKITTMSGTSYTIWNAEVIAGEILQWRGGDKLPLYNESARPEHRDYNVSVKFFFSNSSNGKDLQLNGYFQWNITADGDVCFDAVDLCADPGSNHFDILPNQEPEIIVPQLSMNQTCTFKLSGLFGTTWVNYQSPSCENPAECESESLKLRNPSNLELMATEESSGTWKVCVNWTLPEIPPKRYKLILRASNNSTLEVPGNATEAIFTGVVSEALYNVSIYSIIDDAAHTSIRGLLPPHRMGAGGAGAGAAATWCAGAAAAVAVAVLLVACCRRTRSARRYGNYCYSRGQDKPSKEGDSESLEVEGVRAEDEWEVRPERLLLHEVLGEGAFGLVRRARLAPHGREVAVKMLKDFPSLEEIRSFRSEMELMKSVGVHRHIVSLVGCCSGRRPLIIAEYCSRGDLLNYLRCFWDVIVSKRNAKYYNNNTDTSDYRNDLFKCNKHSSVISQSENSKLVVNKLYDLQDVCEKELTALDLLSFCRQIAMGMEFLASNRVVHRDLAARNILVTSDKTLKIADFGLSRDVYEDNQYKQKGNGKMPVKWMALESLTRRIYTTQSDVWSFGVVVWEVVTVGAAPYPGVAAARLVRLLRAGYRMPRPTNCSQQLYELMLSCWRAQPRERATFAELHARLDELLGGACADRYLSLELEPDDAPPTPRPHRYIRMLIGGKRNWSRGESYERPLKVPQSNHYTSPPAVLNRTQPV